MSLLRSSAKSAAGEGESIINLSPSKMISTSNTMVSPKFSSTKHLRPLPTYSRQTCFQSSSLLPSAHVRDVRKPRERKMELFPIQEGRVTLGWPYTAPMIRSPTATWTSSSSVLNADHLSLVPVLSNPPAELHQTMATLTMTKEKKNSVVAVEEERKAITQTVAGPEMMSRDNGRRDAHHDGRRRRLHNHRHHRRTTRRLTAQEVVELMSFSVEHHPNLEDLRERKNRRKLRHEEIDEDDNLFFWVLAELLQL